MAVILMLNHAYMSLNILLVTTNMYCKLMRLDRGRPEIRSKSYSNRPLIDFFDPNLPVRSIVATILI